MSLDRLISSLTDLSTSTISSPHIVLPAPMICEWKTSSVTGKEIRDGLVYEMEIVLKFFHFILSFFVFLSLSCPVWTSQLSIPTYLSYYMFVSSWKGASSKSRHIWRSIIHPHFIIHAIFLFTNDDFFRCIFFAYSFMHVFFLRIAFHPYIATFVTEPFHSTRLRVGIVVLSFILLTGWLLKFYNQLTTSLAIGFTLITVWISVGIVSLIAHAVVASSTKQFGHLVHSPFIDLFLSIDSIFRFRSSTGMTVSSFLRLVDAHIDTANPDPAITLETLVEWLAHERGVAAWQFVQQFKTYRLGKKLDPQDVFVPQDILDAVEAGRRDRWVAADSPLMFKTPLLTSGHC